MQPRLMIKRLNLLPQGQNNEPIGKQISTFPKRRKKTKPLTAVLALECETGMLLSYYKGGLISENNVFVFSSAVVVTQCYVCANLLSCCTDERQEPGTRNLRLTACRALQVLQDRAGAKPKRRSKTGLESYLFRVAFLEMSNGAGLSPVRHLLQFRHI